MFDGPELACCCCYLSTVSAQCSTVAICIAVYGPAAAAGDLSTDAWSILLLLSDAAAAASAGTANSVTAAAFKRFLLYSICPAPALQCWYCLCSTTADAP